MDWAQVLVIILSVFLAIFLLLGIILTVMLIRVTRQIQTVAKSAERSALKAENFVANISAVTTPAIIGKVASAFVNGFKKK